MEEKREEREGLIEHGGVQTTTSSLTPVQFSVQKSQY